MRRLAVFLMLVIATCAARAHPHTPADSRGFYVGAGVGYADPSSYEDDYWYSDTESGDGDDATVVFAGYRFHRHVAVEAAWLDTGDLGWSESLVYVPDLLDVYNTDIALDATASQLSVLGILPFAGIWEVFLRGGVAWWDADAQQRFTPSFGGATVERSVYDDGAGLLFGIGGSVTFLSHLHARLEYQVFDVDEDLYAFEDDSASIDTVLLDLQYRFSGL
jgi:opacity protein-like surface antigen